MKTHRKLNRGFTLIEILGGLAILGIIAAVTIPAVQKARQRTAITAVIKTVPTVAGAVQDFIAKSGGPGYPPLTEASAVSSFTLNTGNSALTGATAAVIGKAATLDSVLIAERCLESPLAFEIGNKNNTPSGTVALYWDPTNNYFNTASGAPSQDFSNVPRIECEVSSTSTPGTDGTNFYFDSSNTNLPTNSRVVSIVIPNVTAADAASLANRLDNKSTASSTAANTVGRVAYAAPSAAGLTTVYIYVNHF